MNEFKEIYDKAYRNFIEERTKREVKIANFAMSISSVNIEEVFGDVYIPPDFSLKALCPEMYEKIPNPEVVNEQQDKLISILDKIDNRLSEYYSDALEAYNEYQQTARS